MDEPEFFAEDIEDLHEILGPVADPDVLARLIAWRDKGISDAMDEIHGH